MELVTVQSGDTLSAIAARYGISSAYLAQINGLLETDPLVIGQVLLVLLPAGTYTVQPGDTLSSVAAQYDLTVNALLAQNPFLLGDPARLQPGDILVISYQTARRGTLSVNGYLYPFIDLTLLRRTLPYLSYMTVFSYGVSADGELTEPDDAAVLSVAREYGVPPVLLLSTIGEDGLFDSDRADTLLSDSAIQQNIIASLAAVTQEKGYAGVDVDFEYVTPGLREAYAAFVSNLRTALEPLGKFVWVALAPKTSSIQKGLLYEAHDYRLLGEAANAVLLMTYEWGYAYSEPMAVAPIDKVTQVLRYGLTQIPADKIFLGIPNYGYDWPLPFIRGVTKAASIGNEQAVDIAADNRADIRFNTQAASPFFNYTNQNGTAHEVWFEDARSVLEKLSLASNSRLLGVGYWNIMRPFFQNWMLLDALYTIRRG